MTAAEQLGLRNLQDQYPNHRITVDRYGVAIIEPVDRKVVPRNVEQERAVWDRAASIGRSTLIKLEVEEGEE